MSTLKAGQIDLKARPARYVGRSNNHVFTPLRGVLADLSKNKSLYDIIFLKTTRDGV